MAGGGASRLRWPRCQIPFITDPAVLDTERINITSAMEAWQSATCCRFIPRDSHATYLSVLPGLANNSCTLEETGSGVRLLRLGVSCPVSILLPLLGHLIGLDYEQTRFDSPSFVQFTSAATSDPLYQPGTITAPIGPYDYSSVMHSAPVANVNGRQVIMMRSPRSIGAADRVSTGDSGSVSFLYGKADAFGACQPTDALKCTSNLYDYGLPEAYVRVQSGTSLTMSVAVTGGAPPYNVDFIIGGGLTSQGRHNHYIGTAATAGNWPAPKHVSLGLAIAGNGKATGAVKDSNGATCNVIVYFEAVVTPVCFNKTGVGACGGALRGVCVGASTAPFVCACNPGFVGAECEYDVTCATAGGGTAVIPYETAFGSTPIGDPRIVPFSVNTSTAYGVTWLMGTGQPLSPVACQGGGCMLLAEGHGIEIQPFGAAGTPAQRVRWRCLSTAVVDACGVELLHVLGGGKRVVVATAKAVVTNGMTEMLLNGVSGSPSSIVASGKFIDYELRVSGEGSQLAAELSAVSDGRLIWAIRGVPLLASFSSWTNSINEGSGGGKPITIDRIRIFGPSAGAAGSSIFDSVSASCYDGAVTPTPIVPSAIAPYFIPSIPQIPGMPGLPSQPVPAVPQLPATPTAPQPPGPLAAPNTLPQGTVWPSTAPTGPAAVPPQPSPPPPVSYVINVSAAASECRATCSPMEGQIGAETLKNAVFGASRGPLTVLTSSDCMPCGTRRSSYDTGGGAVDVAPAGAHVGSHRQLIQKRVFVQLHVMCTDVEQCELACATVKHAITAGATHTGLDYTATSLCRRITTGPDANGTPGGKGNGSTEWSFVVAIVLPILALLAVSCVFAAAAMYLRVYKPPPTPDGLHEFGPQTMQLPPLGASVWADPLAATAPGIGFGAFSLAHSGVALTQTAVEAAAAAAGTAGPAFETLPPPPPPPPPRVSTGARGNRGGASDERGAGRTGGGGDGTVLRIAGPPGPRAHVPSGAGGGYPGGTGYYGGSMSGYGGESYVGGSRAYGGHVREAAAVTGREYAGGLDVDWAAATMQQMENEDPDWLRASAAELDATVRAAGGGPGRDVGVSTRQVHMTPAGPRDAIFNTPPTRFASDWGPRARIHRAMNNRGGDPSGGYGGGGYVHAAPFEVSLSPPGALLNTPARSPPMSERPTVPRYR